MANVLAPQKIEGKNEGDALLKEKPADLIAKDAEKPSEDASKGQKPLPPNMRLAAEAGAFVTALLGGAARRGHGFFGTHKAPHRPYTESKQTSNTEQSKVEETSSKTSTPTNSRG
jgi:hypothetical protein